MIQNTADEVIVYSCAPSLYMHVWKREYTFWVQFHKCPLYKNIEVTEKEFSAWYDPQQYRDKATTWDWH